MHPFFRGPSKPKQADRDSQCTKHSRPEPYFWSHLSRTPFQFSLIHKPIKCYHSRYGKCTTKSDCEEYQTRIPSIKPIYETEHVRHRGEEGEDDCEVKCDVNTQEGDNGFRKKHLGGTKKGDEEDAE